MTAVALNELEVIGFMKNKRAHANNSVSGNRQNSEEPKVSLGHGVETTCLRAEGVATPTTSEGIIGRGGTLTS
jgi:hypothetical protein